MAKPTFNHLLSTGYLKSNWRWSLGLIFLVLMFFVFQRGPLHKTYITSDGHCYYAHLPAVFIYHDLHFSFIDDIRNSGAPHTQNIYDFIAHVDGGIVSIGYGGVAILWAPAFLIAHTIATIGPAQANGYSTPYQLAILFSAIFYLMLGLWAFGRLLENLRIKPWIIAACLFLMVFATSTLYYTVDEPSFTHIYTLSLFSVFLLYTKRFFESYRIKHLWILMLTLALLGLIRPTNIVMLLAIPMLAGSLAEVLKLLRWVFSNFTRVLLPLIAAFAILFLQPLLYFLQTGSFFVWSYQGVSFNFSDPQILNVLFSYEKGLFVYTPVLLLALVGLWPLLRTDRFFLLWLTLSIAVPVYVISSWWNWWYGMSFGHRAFIDYYPLFFISIALGFEHIKNKLTLHFFIFMAVMSLGLNQIYMKQYRDYIFYWQMDKDMFWRVFLHTSRPYAGLFWEEEKLQQTLIHVNEAFPVQKSIIKMGYENPEEQANVQLAKGIAHTGIFSAKLESEQMYATILNMTVPDSLTSQELAILSSVFMQPLENPIKQELYFILEVWRDGQIVQRLEATTRTHNQFTHQWNRLLVIQRDGFFFLPGDSFLVYLYNPFKNTVYWDDFSLYLYGRD